MPPSSVPSFFQNQADFSPVPDCIPDKTAHPPCHFSNAFQQEITDSHCPLYCSERMLWQAHSLCCLFSIRLQKKFYNLHFFIVMLAVFFALFLLWFFSFRLQPISAWFFLLVFCKTYFFPAVLSLITFVTIRTMLSGVFISISDVSIHITIQDIGDIETINHRKKVENLI